MEQQVDRRTITMYPRQWEIAEEYARREGFNLSLAMRKIIEQWDGFKKIALAPNHEPALQQPAEE